MMDKHWDVYNWQRSRTYLRNKVRMFNVLQSMLSNTLKNGSCVYCSSRYVVTVMWSLWLWFLFLTLLWFLFVVPVSGVPWKVFITTGTPPSGDQESHMTSHVTIAVYGTLGQTGEISLTSTAEQLYTAGQTDEFDVSEAYITLNINFVYNWIWSNLSDSDLLWVVQ